MSGPTPRWQACTFEEVELCEVCDEYHEGYVACPYMRDFRRTTDLEEEEIDRAAFVRHDERIFG